jgi:hypothetical protein
MAMINCPECKKEISDAAPACPHCGSPVAAPKRSVGILLGIGILLFPVIFAWFTLRKGHTTVARGISFAWLAFCVIAVFAQDSKTTGTVAATTAGAQLAVAKSEEAPAAKEEVVDVRIGEILSAYKANEVGADNRYKGKLIRTTGVIDSVKKDIMDNLYVTIGTGASFEIPQVQAFFDDSMNNQLGQLQKGTKLTVVCRVDGLMMNVIGKECVIQ